MQPGAALTIVFFEIVNRTKNLRWLHRGAGAARWRASLLTTGPTMNTSAKTASLQNRRDACRLILAARIPLAASGVQWFFWAAIQPYVWFLFFPAVFFRSWLGGLRGGLVATALSTGLVWYFFIPPQFSFAVQSPMPTSRSGCSWAWACFSASPITACKRQRNTGRFQDRA